MSVPPNTTPPPQPGWSCKLSRTCSVDTSLITDLIKFCLFQAWVQGGGWNNTCPPFWYYGHMWIGHGWPGGLGGWLRCDRLSDPDGGDSKGKEESVQTEVRDNAQMQICPSGTGIYTFTPLSEHTGDTTASPSVAKLLWPKADAHHQLDRLVVILSSAPARSALLR